MFFYILPWVYLYLYKLTDNLKLADNITGLGKEGDVIDLDRNRLVLASPLPSSYCF